MTRNQRTLSYMAVLLCMIVAINFMFYISDKKDILQQAKTNEWVEVKITWLFSPSPTLRHYRVLYTDGLGVNQDKHVLVELTETSWRDYP